MLKSTYKLFDTENPLGENRPEITVVAPSRHKLTIGQELRGEWARWYASPGIEDYFASQPAPYVGSFKFSFRKTGENWTGLIHEAKPIGGSAWKDDHIPAGLPNTDEKDLTIGAWFKTNLDGGALRGLSKLADLQAALAETGGPVFLAADGTSPIEGFDPSLAGALIIDRTGQFHFFGILSAKDLFLCTTVRSERTRLEVRSPERHALEGKKIGIVGLGSAGSKIAMSLARMGTRKFYLVDHDVLLPENLQRHALDWLGVIQHKVDSLAVALKRVATGVHVEVCRYHLTGQESNAAVSGALDKLAECDLIIDATAEPRAFNLLAAVVRSSNRPMIWLEVYGGGLGGMVARSRPSVDPTPQDMRGAYLKYCTDNPDPTAKPANNNYGVETDDGKVMVASDADIAVIAHHAARFAPDCFAAPEDSKFPHSMYLVGLAKGWVFEQPFVTIPISMASLSTSGWSKADDMEFSPELAGFLVGLSQKRENATAITTGYSVTPG
jgi:molybdopterin/thiamine biosynthesis adenylyltransferase